MLKIQVQSSPADVNPPQTQSLADLSRNASVISSSSSSSSTSDLTVHNPAPPRAIRTFSSPSKRPLRSRSPQSPSTPRGSKPPVYLARELGMASDDDDRPTELRPPTSRTQSRSRNSSVNGRSMSSPADFEFGRILGEGSYSTVMLAKNIHTGQEFAIKVLDKGHLKRKDKMATAMAEKNTLVRLGAGHPGIVRLHSAFQDEWSLFFVLDLAKNGELQSRISKLGSLSLPCTRYYTAQIVDALDYMHSKGVIHRDLKPENLLLDDKFRIKITDFGTGKIIDTGATRAKTFVGTAQYVAPELLENSETSKSSDFWALGCILYQMISGRFAFQGLSEYLTWDKIKRLDYSFPDGFDEDAKDLVQKLLVRDPSERLGAGEPGTPYDLKHLRSHPFFAGINWTTLWTDPAPPLEVGIYKKEITPQEEQQRWHDVGAEWDELVDGNGTNDEDDISWASDGEGEFKFGTATNGGSIPNVVRDGAAEVGPMGEIRDYAYPPKVSQAAPVHEERNEELLDEKKEQKETSVTPTPAAPLNGSTITPTNGNGSNSPSIGVRFATSKSLEGKGGETDTAVDTDAEEDRDTVPPNLDDIPLAVRTQPIDVPPRKKRDSSSTGSATSSSGGSSPIEKLGAALEAAGLNRGRNRAQTPIQGNGIHVDEEWSALLNPGETVVFNATVETSALLRRASRLLAMAVAPRRKSREMVLTDKRLVCFKNKPGRKFVIRNEFLLSKAETEKSSDKYVITGVEPKGDREFVILTSSKSYAFVASSPSIASTWVRKIREALESRAPKIDNSTPTVSPSRRT
ncbi:kinase-like domain-containing protein [Abortiporus biennis]|nr:kinase-like domain-containing protein [Abortiporus biennis]